MKLFDLHVHTKESSECGELPAREIVDLYREYGYSGFVVTDHCIPRYVKKYPTLADMVAVQRDGYLAAKEYGDSVGFQVFYGCELRFTEAAQTDFLVYGAPSDYFVTHPKLMETPIKEALKLLRDEGFLVYQAHPFRNQMQITDPALLSGIEIYNGHVGYDSRNDFAALWAKQYGLKGISGSDFHRKCDLARGGILCDDGIEDYDDLLSALNTENYRVISKR